MKTNDSATRATSCGMTNHQPAARWEDATPTGNGIVGALVYGHVYNDLTVFNHGALWFRRPPPVGPEVSGLLPELRARLAQGRWREAGTLLSDALTAAVRRSTTTASASVPAGTRASSSPTWPRPKTAKKRSTARSSRT